MIMMTESARIAVVKDAWPEPASMGAVSNRTIQIVLTVRIVAMCAIRQSQKQ
jgi:hypothetical protein